MKKSTLNLIIALVLITIPFGYAAYIYPSLPATIPTHFNYKGEADGFGGKDSIFLGPGILGVVSLFIFFLISNIKHIDPKRVKEEEDGMMKKFALLTVLFLTILSLIIIKSAASPSLNISKLILPAIGLFFAVIGWAMPKIRQNYFAGFRLPWTLENVDNWNETHKVAGKLWMYGGFFQVITSLVFSDMLAFVSFMAITLVMIIVPTVFSYSMFKKGNTIE